MMTTMLGSTRQFEIVIAIIIALFIDMMDVFIRIKITAQSVFHHDTMLKDVTVGRMRMIWQKNPDVAMTIDRSTSFPVCIGFTSPLPIRGSHFGARFFGWMSSFHCSAQFSFRLHAARDTDLRSGNSCSCFWTLMMALRRHELHCI